MRWLTGHTKYLPVVMTVLLGACAQPSMVMRPPPDALPRIEPQGQMTPEEEPQTEQRMADLPGDQKPPVLSGKIEQIDCKSGAEDLHARMALEARGGQIASFAYYSKRKPRTCSLDIHRDSPSVKWRQTADGSTRVQTPHGAFLIRTSNEAYEFEFFNVERQKFCGMDGYINGTMTIKRKSTKPECSVAGLLDREGLPQKIAGSRFPSRD